MPLYCFSYIVKAYLKFFKFIANYITAVYFRDPKAIIGEFWQLIAKKMAIRCCRKKQSLQQRPNNDFIN